MGSASGGDAVNMVEMTPKDLEYYVNLVHKGAAGFERTDFSFKRSSTVGKMLSDSIACYREIICKNSQLMQQTSLFCFQKLPQTLEPSATTIEISQQLLTWRQAPPPAERLQLTVGSDSGYHFLATKEF